MSEHDDLELVMPFLSVASKGGPFADDAYAAGWAMGALDASLPHWVVPFTVSVRNVDVPQADLVAMRHGWTMTAEPYDDEWTACTFTPPEGRR